MGKVTSPRAAGKAAKKIVTKPVSNAVQSAIDGAADIGFNLSGGLSDAVASIRVIVKGAADLASLTKAQEVALARFSLRLKSGFVVRYLMDTPAYAKRAGNYDREQQYDDAALVIAKPEPTSSKAGRRTAIEHKAVKAATESLRIARNRAFGVVRTRTPKTATVPAETVPPVDMVMATPKLANDNDSREYYRNAMAALAKTVAVNLQTGAAKEAKHVAFLVQSIIVDARAAVDKALA